MIIYLVAFILSAIFFNLATKRSGAAACVLLALAMAFPVLLAAFRDDTVGTDLHTYAIMYWDYACESPSFAYYLASLSVWGGTEVGYSSLNWIISRFTTDIHWFFFVHQGILVAFVFAALWKMRNRIWATPVLLFYYLFMYNQSLSLMRQSVAIAIIFFACTFIYEEHKKKWTYILILAATLFHSSALFALLIPIVRYLSDRYSNNMKLLYILAIVGTVALFVTFQFTLTWLLNHGLVSAKYEMYADQEGFKSHKINLAVEFLILSVNFLFVKSRERNQYYFNFIQFSAFLCILMELVGGVVEVANRVVIYLILTVVMYGSYLSDNYNISKKLMSAYVFAALVMFVYLCSKTGVINGETIPYTSKILGIR